MTSRPTRATARTAARLAVVPLALTAAAARAQVPFGYLLVAERPLSATAPPLSFVDPATGVVTPVLGTGIRVRSVSSARLDAADPTAIYFNASTQLSAAIQLRRLTVSSNVTLSEVGAGGGVPGLIQRFAVLGASAYAAVTTGGSVGLWQVPLAGGTPAQVAALPGLGDVTALGGKVYACTYAAGGASTVIEYDPAATGFRTLGTAYPPIRALGPHVGQLLAGTDGGDVLWIDPATGAATPLLSPGKGAVTAIASDPGQPVFHFATDRNEVWSLLDLTTPLYRSATAIVDLVRSPHDVASALLHGTPCGTTPPAIQAAGLPSLGNPAYGLSVSGAPPMAAAALLLGVSRVTFQGGPLPLALDAFGMPGCALLNDVLLVVGAATDAGGTAVVPIPIPALGWKGGHFAGQFFVVDPVANPLGVSATAGVESIVR